MQKERIVPFSFLFATFFSFLTMKSAKFLNENIYRMSSVLKFFKIGNGELSIFNKYKFVDPDEINEVLKRSNSKLKIPDTLKFSGFQRISENRLSFLCDVGLSYLTLNRKSNTLSGGETQRINLATSLGSALVGSIYVLDEPSVGLHPEDTTKLIKILKNLKQLGNSVNVAVVKAIAEKMTKLKTANKPTIVGKK